jgi:hypothetical protein
LTWAGRIIAERIKLIIVAMTIPETPKSKYFVNKNAIGILSIIAIIDAYNWGFIFPIPLTNMAKMLFQVDNITNIAITMTKELGTKKSGEIHI